MHPAIRSALLLHRKPSGVALFNGDLGPYSILRVRVDHQLLTWLQDDPEMPRTRQDLEGQYNYHKASNGAKKRNDADRIQVMGQTVGRPLGRCNGCDATRPMPGRLCAFARGIKAKNADSLDDLHGRLKTHLASYSEEQLGEDGARLKEHPSGWLFTYGMIQVIKPGVTQCRTDWKHIDGGASLVHLGFGLFGTRFLHHWEQHTETPHELEEASGSVYISSPLVYKHQVVHRDHDARVGDHLMPFGEMGPCKVAVQLRCDLFPHNRGRVIVPTLAREIVGAVIQPWLSQTTLLLPSLKECLREEQHTIEAASCVPLPQPEPSGPAGGAGEAAEEEAGSALIEAGSTTASPDAIETVRALEAGDTVKVLTGTWAGEVRIVSEAKAETYEVDEQWFERSQLEFQF